LLNLFLGINFKFFNIFIANRMSGNSCLCQNQKISNPKKEMQDACPGSVLQLWN